MWLSLLLFLLLIAIILYQTLHGFFNALLMTVLTVCCAALAMGTYQWVAGNWLAPHWKPDYAQAIAVSGIFGVSLIILRVITDQIIKRSNLLPSLIDRAGAAVCGLVTALTIVGVAGFGLQHIPFDKAALGYARLPQLEAKRDEEGNTPDPRPFDAEENEIWLGLDRFTVAMVGMFSDGVFSGKNSLKGENPDLVQAVGWVNSTRAEVSRYAPPRSISVMKTEDGRDSRVVEHIFEIIPSTRRNDRGSEYTELTATSNREYRVVRLSLKPDAKSKVGKVSEFFFALPQIRLVGTSRADGFKQYRPIAIQEELDSDNNPHPINRHIHSETLWGKKWTLTERPFQPRSDHPSEVEVVYEVPRDFEPWYIQYKLGGARAGLSFADDEGATEPTTSTRTSEPPPTRTADAGRRPSGDTAPSRGRRGNVRTATTQVGRSFFGDRMPMVMQEYNTRQNTEISRGTLKEGHLTGKVAEQEGGGKTPVRKLQVPEEKRLLHLNVSHLQARSTLGRARQFATRTIQNYLVTDATGRQYRVCGKYAIADVNGERYVEVQYFPNQMGTLGGLGKFQRIKDSDLMDDYELVLLFLVEPGARITRFTTGGSADRADDLESENLVAPD